MRILAVLIFAYSAVSIASESQTFCNGQMTEDAAGSYYPNGQITSDSNGFYYPSGRLTKDKWASYYPDGRLLANNWGIFYPNGQLLVNEWGCYLSDGKRVECGEHQFSAHAESTDWSVNLTINPMDKSILMISIIQTIQGVKTSYSLSEGLPIVVNGECQ